MDIFFSHQVNKCTMTNDRSLLDESDAVLFHVGALWNYWRGAKMPDRRHSFQVINFQCLRKTYIHTIYDI